MKFLYAFFALCSSLFFLQGCGSSTPADDNATEASEMIERSVRTYTLTPKKLDDLVKSKFSAMDDFYSATLEGDKIIVSAKIKVFDATPKRDVASVRFLSIANDLLKFREWQTLEVNYEDIGTLTMQRNETGKNSNNKTVFKINDILQKFEEQNPNALDDIKKYD